MATEVELSFQHKFMHKQKYRMRIEDTVQGLCVWVLHTSVCKGCQIHRHLVLVKKGLGVWRECLFHMKKHQSLPFWVWSEPPCFDSDLKSIPWHIGVSLLMTTFPKNLQWVFWGWKWWFLMKLAKRNISNRFWEPTYPGNTEEIELKNWTLNINDFYRSKWICNWEGFLALINTNIVKLGNHMSQKSLCYKQIQVRRMILFIISIQSNRESSATSNRWFVLRITCEYRCRSKVGKGEVSGVEAAAIGGGWRRRRIRKQSTLQKLHPIWWIPNPNKN